MNHPWLIHPTRISHRNTAIVYAGLAVVLIVAALVFAQ